MITTILKTDGTPLIDVMVPDCIRDCEEGRIGWVARIAAENGHSLANANLHSAFLREVDFTGTDLRHACLAYAWLQGANLTRTNLTGAELRGADLTGARFEDTIIGNGLCVSHNPMRIAGLEHEVIVWPGVVKIGHIVHTIADWLDPFEEAASELGAGGRHFVRANRNWIMAAEESITYQAELHDKRYD